MNVITKKMLIENIATHWKHQYPPGKHRYGEDKDEKLQKLIQLPKNATEKDVENIIGNNMWTQNKCHECSEDSEITVQLGEELNYDSSTANICLSCLQKALYLANSASKPNNHVHADAGNRPAK